jgi:2-polyprenyl-3-methyl-5-hydroxy-6-metoxy-1,4-benzoquinol methylase
VPVLGIEPAANVARAALAKGIATTVRFFGLESARQIAQEHGRPDLIVGNNVLAHVPDLNDFVAGIKILSKLSRRANLIPAATRRPLTVTGVSWLMI